MSVSRTGKKLTTDGIYPILSELLLARKTGRIEVARVSAGTGVLAVERGELVHAATATLRGEEAFFEIGMWTDGTFAISEEIPAERSIERGTDYVILELLRRLDVRSATTVLSDWRKIPGQIEAALRVPEAMLDAPFGPKRCGLTRRETIHHIAEANVVAAGIVIAALGAPGSIFDWSWMQPFGPWLERMDYAHKPIEPTRRLVEALNAWVAVLIEPLSDGLMRQVMLRDTPGGEPRRATIVDVLRQEIDHAREHLEEE